ncbi:LOW QUALITY PROTEIN: hypothetical protein Cgig2_031976 [Carnegiea gigantea]|uniref:Uncharacterized protein n=1 Tax=Carnegiea gigantea TaxID=171969 RepID=A0A9Q1K6T3_9CARY|nr:LOW QUALITY PROTEIN: hypothetical protein Cgig2_031976 [Carnegiea gigantea]
MQILQSSSIIKGGNSQASSPLKKSWRLCTLEEVEDVEKLLKALTVWCAGLLESTIHAVSSSVITVQALVMDKHLGPHFQIPAGSVFVFTLIWASISLVLLDRCTFPAWQKLRTSLVVDTSSTNWNGLLLQHGIVSYTIIEHKRRGLVHTHNLMNQAHAIARSHVGFMAPHTTHTTRNRVCILFARRSRVLLPRVPQISLRTTSTAMSSLRLAVGYYLSTAIVWLVEDNSSWLPHDINHGRVYNVYWLVSILGAVNFVIYVTTAKRRRTPQRSAAQSVSTAGGSVVAVAVDALDLDQTKKRGREVPYPSETGRKGGVCSHAPPTRIFFGPLLPSLAAHTCRSTQPWHETAKNRQVWKRMYPRAAVSVARQSRGLLQLTRFRPIPMVLASVLVGMHRSKAVGIGGGGQLHII